MTRKYPLSIILFTICLIFTSCEPQEQKAEWINLFNGQNLDGWHIKIRGYELDNNFGNTFRVEDGLLTVGYEAYENFDDRFGHLFYKEPFSNYLLRIEYRILGDQVSGGPGWAFKNSGVMLHSQSPESMGLDQDFPISIEVQFLGGDGENERPTGNLCTPGTHVEMNGKLDERHCITANAPTYHREEWVTIDVLVEGNDKISHIIDGDTVISYTKPVIGGGVVDGYNEDAKPDGTALTGGYIALQSESHPIQFRTVKLKKLD